MIIMNYQREIPDHSLSPLPLAQIQLRFTRVSSYAMHLGKDLHSLVPASLCSHEHDSPRAPGHGQAYLV